ncbi:hypothetical protein NJ76_09770 [Rhodococcus sp. IITR03]|nr:hypothetical protein NJ76_09770 [Rhodococcus sp. IITR03]
MWRAQCSSRVLRSLVAEVENDGVTAFDRPVTDLVVRGSAVGPDSTTVNRPARARIGVTTLPAPL